MSLWVIWTASEALRKFENTIVQSLDGNWNVWFRTFVFGISVWTHVFRTNSQWQNASQSRENNGWLAAILRVLKGFIHRNQRSPTSYPVSEILITFSWFGEAFTHWSVLFIEIESELACDMYWRCLSMLINAAAAAKERISHRCANGSLKWLSALAEYLL